MTKLEEQEESLLALEGVKEELKAKISEVQKDINLTKVSIYKLQTRLDVGMKVKIGDDTGEITDFHVDYGDPTPVMTLYKKDGTLGLRTRKLYSWDLIKLERI